MVHARTVLDARTIAEGLDPEHARRNGTGYMVRCPAHDDHNPSLQVTTGTNGKTLVKCFAGCSQDAVVAALNDRGLWYADVDDYPVISLPPPPQRQEDDQEDVRPKRWKYYDGPDGAPCFTVVRREQAGRKDFYVNPTPPKANRPLFRLRRLWKRPHAPVLVVEGEKTALAAKTHYPRWVCVTSQGGSNAPERTDWTPLAGRRVVVWPDADAPGRKYAQTVARLVSALENATVSVYTPPEETPLPQGWDLADPPPPGWTRPTSAQLRQLPPWVAPEHDWQIHCLSDLLDQPPPTSPWLVDGVLKVGGVSILAGDPGAGKSVTARSLAHAVVMGQFWAGRDTTATPVLYLALEEEVQDVRKQFQLVGMPRRYAGRVYIASAKPTEGLETPEHIADSLRWVLESDRWQPSPGLVIVDTLADLLTIPDYNSYADTQRFMAPIVDLARSTRSHVLLVHHNRKTRGGGTERVMGSAGITGKVDTVLSITATDAGLHILKTVKRRSFDARDLHVSVHLDTEPVGETHTRLVWRTTPITDAAKPDAVTQAALGKIQAIHRMLAKEGPSTSTAIYNAVGGRKQQVLQLLRQAAKDGTLVVRKGKQVGRNRQRIYALPKQG